MLRFFTGQCAWMVNLSTRVVMVSIPVRMSEVTDFGFSFVIPPLSADPWFNGIACLVSWLRGRETKLEIGSSLLRLLQGALWCIFPRLAESPARHTHIYNSTHSAIWSFWSGRESEETPLACFCRRRFLFVCFCYWATYVQRLLSSISFKSEEISLHTEVRGPQNPT